MCFQMPREGPDVVVDVDAAKAGEINIAGDHIDEVLSVSLVLNRTWRLCPTWHLWC